MKKSILLSVLLLACSTITFAQVTESEKIDWSNLPAFSSSSFAFKSDSMIVVCADCRFVELRSNSGVSGYFLLGPVSFTIPSKKIDGHATAMMLRMNPKDSVKYLKIINPAAISDKGFVSLSLLVLNDIFKRCYHSGMDALIPVAGDFTADIFSDSEGDMLVAKGNGRLEIFNLTKRRNE